MFEWTPSTFPKPALGFDRLGRASISPPGYVVQAVGDTRFHLMGTVIINRSRNGQPLPRHEQCHRLRAARPRRQRALSDPPFILDLRQSTERTHRHTPAARRHLHHPHRPLGTNRRSLLNWPHRIRTFLQKRAGFRNRSSPRSAPFASARVVLSPTCRLRCGHDRHARLTLRSDRDPSSRPAGRTEQKVFAPWPSASSGAEYPVPPASERIPGHGSGCGTARDCRWAGLARRPRGQDFDESRSRRARSGTSSCEFRGAA
jgi:hypothetical protein